MASSGADVVPRVQAAVHASLERHGLVATRQPLLVAVSGGADSLCLLDALVAVLRDATDRLVVGHVDHRLRHASGDDAAYVQSVAAGAGLRCEVVVADVLTLMAERRIGMEEAARFARYQALRTLNEQHCSAAILTGHTRDDSVETVVMHLLRGSGRRGLVGIEEHEYLELWPDDDPPGIRLARPLLPVSRAETTAYCMARGIRWLTDPTNTDPRMLRNRVRHHLLPVLRTYNPAVDEALDRLATVMQDEEAYLHEATVRCYDDIVRRTEHAAWITLGRWNGVPIALQRRLVRTIAQHLGHQEIGLDAVARALAVATADGPPRAELGGGIVVKRLGDDLIFERPDSIPE